MPPTCVLKQRLVGVFVTSPPAQFSMLPYFSSNIHLTCSCLNQRVCACMYKCQGHFIFVCYLCVSGVGGMNPNEIFYGPVDLLIVPQVLSLLTPNLLETTCWAWFFSLSPSLLLLLFLLFFILYSSSSFLKVTSVLFHAAACKSHTNVYVQYTYNNAGVVAASSPIPSYIWLLASMGRSWHLLQGQTTQ